LCRYRPIGEIAQLLNEGRQFEAVLIASSIYLVWNDHVAEARKANFNPAEPRQSGQWARVGATQDAQAPVVDVQYRGFFHDVVVEDLLKGLRSSGSVVLKNVHVLGLDAILAIPDGASLPKGRVVPYFMRTGRSRFYY